MKTKLKISISAVFILTSTLFFGQNQEIKGTVISKEGAPLENAAILVKGTNNGTTSNAFGKFSLTALTN